VSDGRSASPGRRSGAVDLVTVRGLRMRAWLCPVPPRQIPGRRALSVAFRTAHLATFGVLLGGHVLGVEPARLTPFLVGTAVSGVLLVMLDLASTCEWVFEGRGLAVAAKLGILALVPWLWEQRVLLLLLVVVVASVGAHMPGRFRHRSFRRSGGARRMPDAVGIETCLHRRRSPGGSRHGGLVRAAGILGQRVSGEGVGASAAAPAALAPLAAPAAPAEPRGIAQRDEQGVLPVHRDQVVAAHVAGRQGQEPARTDVADVVDEDEAVAVGDCTRRPHRPR